MHVYTVYILKVEEPLRRLSSPSDPLAINLLQKYSSVPNMQQLSRRLLRDVNPSFIPDRAALDGRTAGLRWDKRKLTLGLRCDA